MLCDDILHLQNLTISHLTNRQILNNLRIRYELVQLVNVLYYPYAVVDLPLPKLCAWTHNNNYLSNSKRVRRTSCWTPKNIAAISN